MGRVKKYEYVNMIRVLSPGIPNGTGTGTGTDSAGCLSALPHLTRPSDSHLAFAGSVMSLRRSDRRYSAGWLPIPAPGHGSRSLAHVQDSEIRRHVDQKKFLLVSSILSMYSSQGWKMEWGGGNRLANLLLCS